ncbi:hypothetical protein KSP35_00620 [Aquihabitans sp. G128]|uniref:glycerophosphodiester phosphodiesterase n=1 Tax=Aquihabitans sp. G128 TaxID=2849779 RepID=UPI001C2513C1|nr:glycerophosphodiester phosphodiesterase family protein [Aquihabitans sp. G128]QXC61394.1 hypothetical protein KSP35_00620 [Aquihabitans sp. G128]
MPASPTPRLFAHRFGRAYGPDSAASTLAAAFAQGELDGLETDCCLTADGRLALLHVNYLPLCTTLGGWAHERTAAEITASQLKDAKGRPVDEHPLLLEDLWPLIEGHELTVQLEVKAVGDADLADRTAAVLNEALATSPPPPGVHVEVISFWPDSLPVAASAGWDTRLILATPHTPAALGAWANEHGVTGIILEAPFWDPRHVDVWRAAGLSVMSGVCNDADYARLLVLPYAPDAICTDRPHELRAALEA